MKLLKGLLIFICFALLFLGAVGIISWKSTSSTNASFKDTQTVDKKVSSLQESKVSFAETEEISLDELDVIYSKRVKFKTSGLFKVDIISNTKLNSLLLSINEFDVFTQLVDIDGKPLPISSTDVDEIESRFTYYKGDYYVDILDRVTNVHYFVTQELASRHTSYHVEKVFPVE